MKKTILVTGGCGFIGSSLCKELADQGNHVISLDNYFTGSRENQHWAVDYYEGNTEDLFYIWSTEMQMPDIDIIFHLGEYSRVEQSFRDYNKVMAFNYASFPVVCEFANMLAAKLVYSGSSTKFSVGEDGKTMSPYAYTKAQNTEFLKAYSSWNELDYAIVYFYNVYGDNEIATGQYATVVAKFLNMVKEGDTDLPVTAPGTQLRNFTHINDITSGLILAGLKGHGDGYGIGSPQKYSILNLVKLLGCKPLMAGRVAGNRMDGELMTDKIKELGWTAKHTLEEYINAKFNI